jgi:hypothetical protein
MTEEGSPYCLVQNRLRLTVRTHQSGQVRIFIDPALVRITSNQSDVARENTFCGRLIQLTDEQNRIRALVDVGIPLSVLIPKEQFKNVWLGPGESVCLTCPPESIEFI